MAAPAEASPLRRLVAHSGIYTLSRIASQGAAFFMLPLYTHALGTEGLGVVEITNAARGLLMIVLLQGLHSAWFRLRYNLLEDEAALHRFETSLVWYLLVSNVAIIAVVSVLGANTWNRLAPGVPYYPFGLLTFLASGCTVFGNLVERKLQAQQRAWQFAVFTLLRTIGTLGCIVVFVALLKRGPLGKLEGEVLAGAVGAISAWWILKPGSPRLVSRDDVKRSLAYGWPLVPHGLAGVINDMIDRFMVNSMMGLAAAGVYSLGYRIASVSLIVMMAANQALAPLFIEGMRAVERSTDPEMKAKKLDELARLGLFTLATGTCLVQLVTAGGPEAIALLGTRDFSGSTQVLAPVGAGVIAWVCYAIFTQSLTYDGSGVRVLPWITVSAALANVAINWVLIPRWGVAGAAWATFLSNSVCAVLAFYLGMRNLSVPYAWGRFVALLALSALGLALLAGVETQIGSWPVRAAVKAVWLVAALGVTARIGGLDLRQILRRRGVIAPR